MKQIKLNVTGKKALVVYQNDSFQFVVLDDLCTISGLHKSESTFLELLNSNEKAEKAITIEVPERGKCIVVNLWEALGFIYSDEASKTRPAMAAFIAIKQHLEEYSEFMNQKLIMLEASISKSLRLQDELENASTELHDASEQIIKTQKELIALKYE